ncbi:MAG TPA: GIY-YIG nuclease family protein [Acidobacteriaceae bacterium]|jgi:putative endonuclease|nr:GIY-YIG nuclease family protein [Acidobacteriaceae bacterium]
MHGGSVYILTSKSGTLYIGVPGDWFRRVLEHRKGIRSGFASKHHCDRLVYGQHCLSILAATARETEMKGGRRARKIALIESFNPEWRDLARHWGDRMLMGRTYRRGGIAPHKPVLGGNLSGLKS